MSEPEMVERVARAIHRKRHGDARGWRSVVPEARAAIQAMREPTNPMIDAAKDSGAALMVGLTYVWRDMIDAALAEPTAPR